MDSEESRDEGSDENRRLEAEFEGLGQAKTDENIESPDSTDDKKSSENSETDSRRYKYTEKDTSQNIEQQNTPEKSVHEAAGHHSHEKKEHDTHKEHEHSTHNVVEKKTSGVIEWLHVMGWKTNPFIFNINPSLIVGYRTQRERIMMSVDENHKFILILGPTGSGKTTMLKWLQVLIKKKDVLYVGKPPQKAEEFALIFGQKYPKPWYAFWSKDITSVYQIPQFLNTRLQKKHLVLLIDEAQEASVDVLEWLRVLNDQVENMTIVLSGLPVFEDNLRNNLETFVKRVTAKISLLSLTKEETKELIAKRIKNVGGSGHEFSDHLIESIYEHTGGFPREIIRLCDEIVNESIMKGSTKFEFAHQKDEYRRIPAEEHRHATGVNILDRMTPMQKEILEMLSKRPMTPGQMANAIDLGKYKSRQHAVRSVNNIVKALHEEGYLERKKEDKAYVYSLAQRISTLFVTR